MAGHASRPLGVRDVAPQIWSRWEIRSTVCSFPVPKRVGPLEGDSVPPARGGADLECGQHVIRRKGRLVQPNADRGALCCYAPCVGPEERFNSSTGMVRMPAVCFA